MCTLIVPWRERSCSSCLSRTRTERKGGSLERGTTTLSLEKESVAGCEEAETCGAWVAVSVVGVAVASPRGGTAGLSEGLLGGSARAIPSQNTNRPQQGRAL